MNDNTEPKVVVPWKWTEMDDDRRNDIDFLKEQKFAYESIGRVKDTNYANISSRLKRIENRIQKEVNKLESEKETDDSINGISASSFQELYLVADEDKLYLFRPKMGIWKEFTLNAAAKLFGWSSIADKENVLKYIRDQGRAYMSAAYSFKEDNEDTLNLMRKDHWLKPDKGQVSWWFDILLDSVSGNNKAARKHLEQVVAWKYLHPEEHRLPCIMIYGQGRAGRNTFTINLMRTIFGQKFVDPANFEMVFGQYSGMLKGKVVILIDEAVSNGDGSANRIKSIIGNENIPVNPKFGRQEVIENTALFFMVGNDRSGSAMLDNTPSDARYSLIRVRKSIYENLMEKFDCTMEEAATMWVENMWRFDDHEEVSKWLFHIIQKWKGLDKFPSAYHGDEYKKLVVRQGTPSDDFCRALFGQHFEAVPRPYIQPLAKKFISTFYDRGQQWISNRNKIYSMVDDWIEKNRPEIVKKTIKVSNDEEKRSQIQCYVANNSITRTDVGHYWTEDPYGNKEVSISSLDTDEENSDQ